jgi:hypothetical protein
MSIHKAARVYDNEDLATTWRRISRHNWATQYSKLDQRLRRLEAARVRRAQRGFTVELCNCDD